MPSAAYDRALEESARHHQRSKTFSGSLAPHHRDTIKQIIDRFTANGTPVQSILDYGAGKGLQYEGDASLEAFWGVDVTKYDPAWPPYAEELVGSWDLVICTHTLCWIPTVALPPVVDRLLSLATKAVYVGEMIGPVKKDIVSDPENFPRGWTVQQWIDVLDVQRTVEMHLGLFDAGDLDRSIIHYEFGPK